MARILIVVSVEIVKTLKFVQKLQEAILKTQKNPKIRVIEDTPYGNQITELGCKSVNDKPLRCLLMYM